MTSGVVVFEARSIITMNASRPRATHVAVRDGRILAVGDAADMAPFRATVDDRFRDKILMPGFVEGHSHIMEGMVWAHPYVGAFARRAPDGAIVQGAADVEAIVARLREAAVAGEGPLFAWGFDPLHVGGALTRHDLDRVSTTRPVLVVHASFHILNVNTAALERAGLLDAVDVEGVVQGEDGRASGELQGVAARFRMMRAIGANPFSGGMTEADVERFGASARGQGVTTVTDLHSELSDPIVALYEAATWRENFPARIVPALASASHTPEQGLARLAALRPRGNDKLHFGLVKIVVDGSIQGFTARLRWPGYHNGAPNGLWYVAPDDLARIVEAYHRGGAHLHIHTNGDEATEAALDAIEAAQIAMPRPDHRHTLQHCQMADAALFARMKALGVCVNLFSNHVFYWGDAHHELTMGPERAARIDAAGTAQRLGVPYAIHSDAPITPLAPLFTAWCAANRRTSGGRALGAETEAITVEQALHAVTLGAAYTLKLDHKVGSVEAGKFADFAVLDDDPTRVAPDALKDVGVWGTVVGGVTFPARA